MKLLRFLTAGSVDDGKSTLIGRLLYDSEAISGDILEAIARSTRNKDEGPDLSLLTDGLRAEREQGITIDVAYKYFSTPKRKFIIADAPGHIQYTRNMVTAASTADLIVVLIDARNGVVEQTRRHTLIAASLGIQEVVFAINKIDLVDYSKEVFDEIELAVNELSGALALKQWQVIPVSAKDGDNVVKRSKRISWYQGPALLEVLESVDVKTTETASTSLQVQYVIRPMSDELHDYRGYAGTLQGGDVAIGDVVTILPSGLATRVKAINEGERQLQKAVSGQAISLELEDDIDISRGDTLIVGSQLPRVETEFSANVFWMTGVPLREGSKWLLQQGSKKVRSVVKSIEYHKDIETFREEKPGEPLPLNALGKVIIRTAEPLVTESYLSDQKFGSAILIDETSNTTVGAVLFN